MIKELIRAQSRAAGFEELKKGRVWGLIKRGVGCNSVDRVQSCE